MSRRLSSTTKVQWTTCLLPLGQEDGQVEVARLDTQSDSTILAIHASGCNYKTWSKLASLTSASVVAPNMFGYGATSPWPPAPHRSPTIQDLVSLVTTTASACPPSPLHLLGHSMGGGVALAAAALHPSLPLSSLAVFEPNLFCLLAAGDHNDRQVRGQMVAMTTHSLPQMCSEALTFFVTMLSAFVAEDWELWGRTFHGFWFEGGRRTE